MHQLVCNALNESEGYAERLSNYCILFASSVPETITRYVMYLESDQSSVLNASIVLPEGHSHNNSILAIAGHTYRLIWSRIKNMLCYLEIS